MVSLLALTGAIQFNKLLYMEYLEMNPIVPIPHVSELLAELPENDFSLALASSSPHEQSIIF
ncbi:MAG: hypothetical protein AB2L20_10810 [Mangrovibacterium sp.]|jgi:beta-phosphoglucomutase-like phosphatase (HAD superfamily)